MLVLLSPAKDMDMAPFKGLAVTAPAFLAESRMLVAGLRKLSAAQLARLMDISPKLAQLNRDRYARWDGASAGSMHKAAAWAFNGEVYKGLDAASWSKADRDFAQQHVRILSGLYGVLRPLDQIQAYRLEMGTKWSPQRGAKDLYAFWRKRIASELAQMLPDENRVVVDLASREYVRAVDFPTLKARVVTPVFKDRTAAGYRTLMLFAKRQRGRMCKAIVQERITDPEDLKALGLDGYRYMPAWSTADQWVFARDKHS